MRSIGEIGDHLGQICEKQGQKEEAEKFYAMAMAAPGAMAETQLRLASLLGGSVGGRPNGEGGDRKFVREPHHRDQKREGSGRNGNLGFSLYRG